MNATELQSRLADMQRRVQALEQQLQTTLAATEAKIASCLDSPEFQVKMATAVKPVSAEVSRNICRNALGIA